MLATITILLMLGLIVVGFDIAFAMVLAAAFYFLVGPLLGTVDVPLSIIPQVMSDSLTQELLVAIPLFVLTGRLMSDGGITERLMRLLYAPLSRLRGPLGYINVGASLVMSGMSGSSVADAAATSTVMVDPMVRSGYSRAQAGAITAASATVGPIIPPSIPFVLIAGITTVSVGQLFVAGVFPGLLMGLMLVIMVAVSNRKMPRVPYSEVFDKGLELSTSRIIGQVVVAVLIPVVIMGGIVVGVTTATEAGALGAGIALIGVVTVFGLRDLRALYAVLRETVVVSGAILITLATSAVIGWILAVEQVGEPISDILNSLSEQPVFLWLALVISFLILGLVVEPIAIILIVSPVLFPELPSLGIEPLHFAIVMTVTVTIGMITPPVGLNLFTVAKAGRMDLRELTNRSTPYTFVLAIAAIVLALWPDLTLWLPERLFG